MNIKSIVNAVMLVTAMLCINTNAVAALITGEMGLTGGYSTSGGTDLSDATDISLTSATGTSGIGDLGVTVGFLTAGVIHNGGISLSSFLPVIDVFTIGGWQLDLTTLSIMDQEVSLLTMEGTGVLSADGFENTPANWTFSSQLSGSYSMTVSTVVIPVPAAVWLFGSGLIGLVGVARRKA